MSKLIHLKNVTGIPGRCNDILLSVTKKPATPKCILIFFGGDVQDLEENMKLHHDSIKYVKWSLENTAEALTKKFPQHHLMIVKPSRAQTMSYAVFNCYDNFVQSADQYGSPMYELNYQALEHLGKLVKSVISTSQELDLKDSNINQLKFTLMGFSKGSIVLNQFLHEFHYFYTNRDKDENAKEVLEFANSIEEMWWMDGGHNGDRDTWLTDKELLNSFGQLSIKVQIHVTPYQMKDYNRPWIKSEVNRFNETLRELKVPVKMQYHFEEEEENLEKHFDLLNTFENDR